MLESENSFETTDFGREALAKAKELFAICDKEDKGTAVIFAPLLHLELAGFIIKRDIQRLQSELPDFSPEQLEEVFDSLDIDKNGYLSPEEFIRGFGRTLVNAHSAKVVLQAPS